MTTDGRMPRMTMAERVAYLRDHGWTRTEAHGSQTWVSPDGREFGTLVWAMWRAHGLGGDPTDRMVCDGCHASIAEIERIGHQDGCDAAGRHVGAWCDHTQSWPACIRPTLAEGDLAPWPK